MNRLLKNIEIVHDLLQIQHERAITYEKLLQFGNQDDKICMLLKKLAIQSRNCMLELRSHISDTTGSDPADRVEIKGEILREWHGLHHFMPDSPYQDIISCFEINEMRTSLAYEKALLLNAHLCDELKNLIRFQFDVISRSYHFILESREKPYIPETPRACDERKPPAYFHDRLYAEI